jgi:hypothetical protein
MAIDRSSLHAFCMTYHSKQIHAFGMNEADEPQARSSIFHCFQIIHLGAIWI